MGVRRIRGFTRRTCLRACWGGEGRIDFFLGRLCLPQLRVRRLLLYTQPPYFAATFSARNPSKTRDKWRRSKALAVLEGSSVGCFASVVRMAQHLAETVGIAAGEMLDGGESLESGTPAEATFQINPIVEGRIVCLATT